MTALRRLRIAHVIVHPVLVWDDGEELEAGPALAPITLPLSRLFEVAESLPGEVALMQAQLTAEQPD